MFSDVWFKCCCAWMMWIGMNVAMMWRKMCVCPRWLRYWRTIGRRTLLLLCLPNCTTASQKILWSIRIVAQHCSPSCCTNTDIFCTLQVLIMPDNVYDSVIVTDIPLVHAVHLMKRKQNGKCLFSAPLPSQQTF